MTAEGDKKEQELLTFYNFLNAYTIIFFRCSYIQRISFLIVM